MVEGKKWDIQCFHCGGDVIVPRKYWEDEPQGFCKNCGWVAFDFRPGPNGTPETGFSEDAWITRNFPREKTLLESAECRSSTKPN
jgi:hypothetical protein